MNLNNIKPVPFHSQAVPGTELLFDQDDDTAARLHLQNYQHLKHGDSHILLVPQPSLTDPNDPLKWSSLKKWATFGNGLAYAFLGAVTGPIMAAWMIPGAQQFNTTLQRMAYANGATLVCQGVATALWMPFAIKYGRRPVYLLSTLLMGLACVWLGLASKGTYPPFILGRVFLGIWEAPIESIVPSTVTDIFFLHDRGAKVSLYGLSVLGGNEIGPMLSAFIIQYLGMDWAFYIVAMFTGLNLVAMILFMPETKFKGARPIISLEPTQPQLDTTVETKAGIQHQEAVVEYIPSPNSRTWLQEAFYLSPSDPDVSLYKAFCRPFVLLAYPTVIWSCLVYGMALSWNVVLGCLMAQLFAPPPYLFSESFQGLVFLSPLIGSLIGTYLCGPVADSVANYLTIRNNGIREPEMRLPTCIVAAILTFAGAIISGVCFHFQTSWPGPVIGFGVLSTGAQMGATIAMSYSLDCHKELSVELMVTVSSVKSLVAWIWTWVVNDWLVRDGPLVVFLVLAAVNTAIYLTTFFIYWKGKTIRLWLNDQSLFSKFNVQ